MADLRTRLQRITSKLGFERDWPLIILGAALGSLTALLAVGYDFAIKLLERGSDGFLSALSPWWFMVVPMSGALVTGLLMFTVGDEGRGPGVPIVIRSLLKNKGIVNARIGLTKVVSSIFTVGTGGSAGVEGPIIQLGAVSGSLFGRRFGTDRDQITTFVGCGAAAGIASIFNAPIAGVFFVLEILLRDFSLKTFTPIVVASVFSNAVTQAILGRNEAIFPTVQAQEYLFSLAELPGYVVLGMVCGCVAVVFSRMLVWTEERAGKLPIHPILRPVFGALLLGVVGTVFVLLMRMYGMDGAHSTVPPFFGNGYSTITELLTPEAYTVGSASLAAVASLLLLVFAFKLIATVLTIGSGGAGGVFAPCLFLGAAVGGWFGVIITSTGLAPEGASPATYALVGMGAVVAAAMHAPLTAILMALELTRDVYVLLPIMLAAVVATVVAQLLHRDSIYTSRLRKDGLLIGSARDLTMLRRIPVSRVPITPLPGDPVYPSDPLSKLITLHAYHSVPDFIVVDQSGAYVGMVTGEDMRRALIDREAIPLLLVAELLRTDLPVIHTDENLDTVFDKFAEVDVSSLPLLSQQPFAAPSRPVGLLTRSKVLKIYQDALEAS